LGGGANTDGLLFKSGLRISEDVSGNLGARIPSGKVVAFRTSTATTSVLSVTATGNVAIAGGLTLSGGLGDYADDTAAAAGGVAIGGFSRTGSVVKIRVYVITREMARAFSEAGYMLVAPYLRLCKENGWSCKPQS